MKSKLLLASLLFLTAFNSKAYIPLTITSGFNADVIANGVGTASATTTDDVDGANYCYVSNGWQQLATSTPITTGLPATGLINSAVTTGLTYQLGSYSANNDLRLPTNTSGTLAFQAPYSAAQNLYILAVTGSGSSVMTVQINFTDATNQINTGIAVSDWYGGTSVALTGFQRLNTTNNVLDNGFNGPNLYQYTVPILVANQTKQISSVQITRTSAIGTDATLNIFAISIQESAVSCAAPTTPTATGITTTTASLNWTQAGTPLQWQIKYGAPGFSPATAGTSIFTATKPYTLNPPLTIATSYDYYVRAVCAAGDTSAWSVVTNFTTACNAPSIVTKKDSFNCGPGVVNLEATTTAGGSIKWYAALTGGAALATGNTYTTPSIAATTTYYIAAAQGTCESSPRQAVVASIRTIPTVNIGNDTTICPGISYTMDATTTGATYSWSTGATTPTLTVNAAGTYSASVTVNKCTGSDSRIITPGVVPVNNLAAITNLCSGDVATLNAGNTGSTFLWTPGAATTQTINVSAGGNHSVVVKSVDGCNITSTTNVIIRPLPVAALGNDTSICEGSQITLNAGNAGYSYLWNTGATTQTINVTDSGTYTVTVTTPYNCVNTEDKHIAFLPSPRTEGFNFIPLFYEELGKVKFSPLNPTDVSTYEWDFGDGSTHSTQMNPVHVYTGSGQYIVTLKVFNGCSDYSISLPINVNLTTGIVTLSKDQAEVMIYPNPASSVIIIDNKSAEVNMENVMVFNTLGAMVYQHKADSGKQHQLKVDQFASGIYSVRILTDKGFIIRKFEVIR
ncbi:MAG: PKD domain-containing protein [Taibaiella sp.]|jgi:hypothetical protein